MNAEQYVTTLDELKDYLQYKGPGGDDILTAGDPLYWRDDKYTIDFDNYGLAIAVNDQTGVKINSEGEMYRGGRKMRKRKTSKRKSSKRKSSKRKTSKRKTSKRKSLKRKH
jgi:hypothetical protein